jgi:hypothetical protein
LAANYKVTEKVRFRPEVRFDQADYANGFLPFGNSDSSSQISGGCSFVVEF